MTGSLPRCFRRAGIGCDRPFNWGCHSRPRPCFGPPKSSTCWATLEASASRRRRSPSTSQDRQALARRGRTIERGASAICSGRTRSPSSRAWPAAGGPGKVSVERDGVPAEESTRPIIRARHRRAAPVRSRGSSRTETHLDLSGSNGPRPPAVIPAVIARALSESSSRASNRDMGADVTVVEVLDEFFL